MIGLVAIEAEVRQRLDHQMHLASICPLTATIYEPDTTNPENRITKRGSWCYKGGGGSPSAHSSPGRPGLISCGVVDQGEIQIGFGSVVHPSHGLVACARVPVAWVWVWEYEVNIADPHVRHPDQNLVGLVPDATKPGEVGENAGGLRRQRRQ